MQMGAYMLQQLFIAVSPECTVCFTIPVFLPRRLFFPYTPSETGFNEPVVVLLRSASGDEEVAAAGANLKGVLLTQDLPHLSHLGMSRV